LHWGKIEKKALADTGGCENLTQFKQNIEEKEILC